MPVTEYERNQLFAWFDEHMGKERAATMMSLLPPVGWSDVATKRDLDTVADRLDAKIDAGFDIAMVQMATKDDLRDLQRSIVTWMLTAQATVVGAVGLLLVALR
jgi:hypothetical protein